MPPRFQKKKLSFSPEEDRRLRELKTEGKSYTYIADDLNRSRNSIIGRWDKMKKQKPDDTD